MRLRVFIAVMADFPETVIIERVVSSRVISYLYPVWSSRESSTRAPELPKAYNGNISRNRLWRGLSTRKRYVSGHVTSPVVGCAPTHER